MIQALRRSIKGDKDKNPQIGIAPKSAVAIVPPKKVSTAGDSVLLLHAPNARLINVVHRSFELSTTIPPIQTRNLASHVAISSTSLAVRTIRTGTKHAIPPCQTHVALCQWHSSKP